MQETIADWQRVVDGRDESSPSGQVLLQSWSRSRIAGLDPDSGEFRLHRIAAGELRLRLKENRPLLEAARPHLQWVASSMASMLHVIYLVDATGVVLASEGTDITMMEQYGLLPGFDWSEGAMGTNGAGTAVVAGRPVAVFGDDHFLRPLRGFVCTAAPIRDPSGRIIGAVDLSTTVNDGRPQNLLVAGHVAFSIERELHASGGTSGESGATR